MCGREVYSTLEMSLRRCFLTCKLPDVRFASCGRDIICFCRFFFPGGGGGGGGGFRNMRGKAISGQESLAIPFVLLFFFSSFVLPPSSRHFIPGSAAKVCTPLFLMDNPNNIKQKQQQKSDMRSKKVRACVAY